MRWGNALVITLMLWILLYSAVAWSGPTEHAALPRDDVVAVLLNNAGEVEGSITITYPGKQDLSVAQQDLAALTTITGWQFAGPERIQTADATEFSCRMTPGARVDDRVGEAVWPVVVAMKRFNRVTVLLLGAGYEVKSRTLDNDFIHMTCSSGTGMTSYDVTINNREFRDVRQVAQGTEVLDGASEQTATNEPKGVAFRVNPWVLVVIGAMLLGLLAYFISARFINPPEVSEIQRRKKLRTLRKHRARFL